jgi:hypothetical protein
MEGIEASVGRTKSHCEIKARMEKKKVETDFGTSLAGEEGGKKAQCEHRRRS